MAIRVITGVNESEPITGNSQVSSVTSNVPSRETKSSRIKDVSDKVTIAEINALEPRLGAQVYDTDNNVERFYNGTEWKATTDNGSVVDELLDNRIVVNQSNYLTTIAGPIDSTKEYFIDGVVDLGTSQIVVPTTGMTLRGFSFDISGLVSSADNYTMFVSETPAIGSGNILGQDYYIQVSGTSSKVYEIYDATGFNAFEFQRVNYIGCTSLGDIHNYRQGLESGTGRFGGSPSLTLHGTWVGGFRITTSITRSMSDTTTEPLFKAGTAFVMNSRFLTDMNVDLGTLQPLLDFAPSNFPNPSTLQLKGTIISRDGAFNASDSNVSPNLSSSDLASDWDGNIGIPNTFVGGELNNTTEVATTIVTQGTAVDLNGVFTASDLQHFDSPSNGTLRHIGINPREFVVNWDFLIDGKDNDNYELFLMKIAALGGVVSVEHTQTRTINNFQGGRDVGIFSGQTSIILNQNDIVLWQVANLLDTDNCTLESDSTWSIKER